MRALVYDSKLGRLAAQTVSLPPPATHQHRVKINASTVHPADLLAIRNHYPHASTIAGNDAVGTTASGQQVIVMRSDIGGVWAEEQNIAGDDLFVVEPPLPIRVAAGLRVNPGTALRLLARYPKCNLLVSAANSHVGNYLLQLHTSPDTEIVGLVRSQDKLAEMQRLFPKYTFYLQQHQQEWINHVKRWQNPAVALDCVGGDLAGTMLSASPPHSTLCSYGAVSGKPISASIKSLVFEGKRVEGFWLSQWCRDAGTLAVREMLQGLCDVVRSGRLRVLDCQDVPFGSVVDGSELTSKSCIIIHD